MRRARIVAWVESLSVKQLRHALVNSVSELVIQEVVRFPEDEPAPYWDSNGDRLDEID